MEITNEDESEPPNLDRSSGRKKMYSHCNFIFQTYLEF